MKHYLQKLLKKLRERKAFALVEIVLSMIIFSFVVIGTVKAFNGTVQAHNYTARQAFMRDKLQSQIALIKSEQRIEEMEETTEPDEDGVYFVKQITLLEDVYNQDDQRINNIFVVNVRAIWETTNEEYGVETYIYQQ